MSERAFELDSVRSGLDIVRLIALGAHGVLIGRLWAYALAARGGREVERILGRSRPR